MRAIVQQAIRDVRTAPSALDAPPTDPALASLREAVDQIAADANAIGALMLEVAPAYLSDADAAGALAPLCDAIGEDLDHGLAARRYALTGDRVPCTAPCSENRKASGAGATGPVRWTDPTAPAGAHRWRAWPLLRGGPLTSRCGGDHAGR
ncbi:hypothetical protein ACWDSL_06340 [Streptomyces sp. NPDC000941]